MAILKISYSKAFQTYQYLGIAKSRIVNNKHKNDFESIRSILEENGVFLIEDTDKTILPSNPTVSLSNFLGSCTYLLEKSLLNEEKSSRYK